MPLINIQSKELERFSPQWWQVRCSVLFIILRGKSLPWLFICKGETQGSSVDRFSVVLPTAARARPAAQGPVQCDTWQGPQRCNCRTLTLHALQQVAASEGDQPGITPDNPPEGCGCPQQRSAPPPAFTY